MVGCARRKRLLLEATQPVSILVACPSPASFRRLRHPVQHDRERRQAGLFRARHEQKPLPIARHRETGAWVRPDAAQREEFLRCPAFHLRTTDATEIKQLINRVKRGELDQGDAQLIEKLLNFLLTIVSLLQRKHTMRGRFIYSRSKETEKARTWSKGGLGLSGGQAREAESFGDGAGRSLSGVRLRKRAFSGKLFTELAPTVCKSVLQGCTTPQFS